MFGYSDLKTQLFVDTFNVECPVNGCKVILPRQRNKFIRDEKFKCPIHKIYISPSTFEYESIDKNLLLNDDNELLMLNSILDVKRESRMERDNSEDALSWNVFRFLEKNRLLDELLKYITKTSINNSNLIYWSYSQSENNSWSLLNKARLEFGEKIQRGSEPDLIIDTDKALFFIEAKLGAKNITIPTNPEDTKNYLTGGDKIFFKLFSTNYETIVIKNKYYELMRFWLLGNWIAEKLNKSFYLISLTRSQNDSNIEKQFGQFIEQSDIKVFNRITWEDIYFFIQGMKPSTERELILNYLKNKTIGYNSAGILVKAFQL